MCVIVIQPENTPMPSLERLRKCYLANSDGAGFMYVKDGKVISKKGYMTWDSFRQALASSFDDMQDTPVVYHFRIGTQGSNDESMCHPFPISDKDSILKARKVKCDVALVHNGIISLTSRYSTHTKEEKSDTYYFVRDYATLIIRKIDWYKDPNMVELLDRLADSKLCILSADKHIEYIGAFETADDGCLYSNSSYKGYSYYSTGHLWQDDDEDSKWSYVGNGTWIPKGEDKSITKYDDKDWDWQDYPSEVRAVLIPEDFYLYNPDDNDVIESAEDLYFIDRAGRAYIYSSHNDDLEPLPNYDVMTAEFDRWVPEGTWHDFIVNLPRVH